MPAQQDSSEESVLGSASELRIEDDRQPVLLAAGTKLHRDAHAHAPVVTVIDVPLELLPIERRDSWVRVRFGGRVGWADLEARPEPSSPAPPSSAAAPPPQPIVASEERVARAVSLLGRPVEELEAPPFRIYTDVPSRRKRKTLFDVTRHLADAHHERYGLAPERQASFAIIVFAREKAYREFEDSVADLEQLDAEGHAGSGVAALVAEGRTSEEAAALLVHEAAHLLNRRAFRGTLPPWLEEGIANDLAYCRLDRSGRLLPRTLGGKGFIVEVPGPTDSFGRRRFAGTIHIEGPLASLGLLQDKVAAGETLPLELLLDLTWREFVAPEGRELRYIQSTFLVRYLLDALDGDRFRGYLAGFQAGGSADASALSSALGVGWDELTEGFEEWVRRHRGRN